MKVMNNGLKKCKKRPSENKIEKKNINNRKNLKLGRKIGGITKMIYLYWLR